MKTELITSRFIVTSPIQIDMHVAVASYLSKQEIVFKYIYYFDNDVDSEFVNIQNTSTADYFTYYLFLIDVIQLHNA